jgi:two-component sensor histidine kinase
MEEDMILSKVRRGERVETFETVRRRKDGSLLDISVTVSPVLDGGGTIIGASKIARDITERRRAQETQNLLMNELNHRVKNTLGQVQAIAQQTLKSTPDPAQFVSAFSGRLQALARVHSILGVDVWQSADLETVARNQLLQGAADSQRLTLGGPKVTLSPQSTMHLALMLHELATNAVKHGAFRHPGGRAKFSWTQSDRWADLTWQEIGADVTDVPRIRGFGTKLIEQSARGQGGHARLSVVPGLGIRWDIRMAI